MPRPTDRWTIPRIHDDDDMPEPFTCACGRQTTTDMMRDISGLAPEHRQRLPEHLQYQDYMCDGCHERLVLEGRFRHHELVEALGAPSHVVEAHRLQLGHIGPAARYGEETAGIVD